MAFKANIPQSTDQVSISQADLLANFQEIDTFVAVDHAAFNTANAGKHYFNQAAAPAAASATQVGIYCKDLGGAPELYINKSASQVPFTKSLKAADGYTCLPSGVIIKWGTGVANNGVNAPINFAGAVDAPFTQPPTVTLSQFWPGGATDHTVFLSAVTATQLTVYGRAVAAETYHYIAIGY